MKKFFALFILFPLALISAEKKDTVKPKAKEALNVKKSSPSQPYYTIENLRRLQSQGKQLHMPCFIFIDEDEQERPDSESSALTIGLAQALYLNEGAILVSPSLINNLLYKSSKSWYKDALNSLIQSNWNMYNLRNFIVLIPKKFFEFYAPAFKINEFDSITNKLPKTSEPLSNFEELLKEVSFSPGSKIQKNTMQWIFIEPAKDMPTMLPILDILLTGHGSTGKVKDIAGLSPDVVNEILAFFDKLTTGVVIINTCYLGGKNLSLLQFENAVTVNHKYPLIVIGTTDEPEHAGFSLKAVAEYTAFFQDRGESLTNLLRLFQDLETTTPHKTQNIPQVWLPGGMGFQAFNVEERVLVLDTVTQKIYEEEKKPLIVQKSEAILIYPQHIDINLLINPWKLSSLEQTQRRMDAKKVWRKMATINDEWFWEGLTNQEIDKIVKEISQSFSFYKVDVETRFPFDIDNFFLYPRFILMAREQGKENSYRCHFKGTITLAPKDCYACGVARFIRDSFFSVPSTYNPFERHVLIDSLTGLNDLALLAKAQELKTLLRGEKAPNYVNIFQKNTDPIITLKQVAIVLGPKGSSLSFELDGILWTVKNPLENGWQWERPQLLGKQVILQKKETGSQQKSISDVLKKKLMTQEVLKKKSKENKK